jgi:hypothetical protein
MFGFDTEFTNHCSVLLELEDLLGSDWCNNLASQANTVPFGPTRLLET